MRRQAHMAARPQHMVAHRLGLKVDAMDDFHAKRCEDPVRTPRLQEFQQVLSRLRINRDDFIDIADDDVVVVDKPAGLVVHPGPGNETGTMLNGLLAAHPGMQGVGSAVRPGIVHRLDRGTSGLLVVALTQMAYDGLVAQLADRSMGRRYLALAWGRFDEREGVVDAPIGRSPRDRTRMAVVTAGREARTGYEVQRWWAIPEVSLVTCRLETGRTHQIRVHMSAIGHPLVGDGTYGGSRAGLDPGRPFLHAEHLAFDHPTTGERLAFDSPLPDDLTGLLDDLGDPES